MVDTAKGKRIRRVDEGHPVLNYEDMVPIHRTTFKARSANYEVEAMRRSSASPDMVTEKAIKRVSENVRKPEEFILELINLGLDYVRTGLEPERFRDAGELLLKCVRLLARDKWTPEIEYAWNEAYERIMDSMNREIGRRNSLFQVAPWRAHFY